MTDPNPCCCFVRSPPPRKRIQDSDPTNSAHGQPFVGMGACSLWCLRSAFVQHSPLRRISPFSDCLASPTCNAELQLVAFSLTPTHSQRRHTQAFQALCLIIANTVSLRNVPTFASLHHPPRPQMARPVIQRCPDAQNTHFTPMLVLTWRPRPQRPRLKRSRIWLSEQPLGLTFIAGQSFGICK